MNERTRVHRVVLIEHDEISRVGLSHLLQKSGNLEIVGEFGQIGDALPKLEDIKPDLVIIRSKFPLVDEVDCTRQVKLTVPEVHILVLAADDHSIFDCLKYGADGYCLMQAPLERLVHAAESVAHGAGWLDPLVAQRVLRNLGTQFLEEQEEMPQSLTRREKEVVALLGQGFSSNDIAAQMVLSTETVNTHIRHAMEKLGLKNRTALAVLAQMENVQADRNGQDPVLVVEDDRVLRDVFVRQLEMLGYRSETAGDGSEAMRLVKQRSYTAIVMDIKLLSVSGLDATKAIREFENHVGRKRTPIVGITSGFCSQEEALAAGMDDLLEKPISMATVSNLLRKISA